ncbi:MAG: hypothetical protein ACTHMA_05230 [Thermomicrobiales bacterium]
MNDRIGEIIETSTVDFWAESAVLHDLPPLGALVAVQLPDELTLYGAVAFGQTGGIDPGRKAVRRGNDDVYDAAIYVEHPELNRILRTTFRVAIIGYTEPGGTPRHHLPPCPPPLHYSVLHCDAGVVRAFTETPRYLPILAASDGEVAPEQLLAAHIRAVWRGRGHDDAWLAAAGRQVARLFKRDYDRLVTVLEAIDPGDWSLPPTDNRLNGHGGKPIGTAPL